MDHYRVKYRHPNNCIASNFLPKILELAQPPIDIEKSTLDQIQERDRCMFFPREQIAHIFQSSGENDPVRSILSCKCGVCKKAGGSLNTAEREAQIRTIWQRPLTILLAILIYIEHVELIGHFAGFERISDNSLDVVLKIVQDKAEEQKWKGLLVDKVDAFVNLFSSAKDMFQPAEFKLNSPMVTHLNTDRMPFLNDAIHEYGSSGKVFKFNIHPDYIDEEVKREAWYSITKQHNFARKRLKKGTSNRLDTIVERDNLRVFTAQRHDHLIRALFFYEWRDHINFVFPFIEGNLEKLLCQDWRPSQIPEIVEKGPMHWLWVQMIGVSEGLSVIHSPRGNVFKNSDQTGRGYHFDLKPANILITEKGQLKITDFGLSIIKQVSPETSSYAIFRGGAPKYQPPEMSTKINIEPNSGFDLAKASYDVWSLACIMLECLNYTLKIHDEGSSQAFSSVLASEGSGQAFHHNGQLKKCVQRIISAIHGKVALVTNRPESKIWAADLAMLLNSMFDCNPKGRPKSEHVFHNLTVMQEQYESQQDDELKIKLKKSTSEGTYPMDHFNEIMFDWPDAKSFMDIDEVFFFSVKAPERVYNCRLRILQRKQDNELYLLRCYREGEIETRTQQFTRESPHFIPLSAYDASRQTSCAVCGKEGMYYQYKFPSEKYLHYFQLALTQHQVLFTCSLGYEGCRVRMKGAENRSADLDSKDKAVYSVQIWKETAIPVQRKESVPYTQLVNRLELQGRNRTKERGEMSHKSQSGSGRAETIAYKLLIFFDCNYITVPLTNRHPKMSFGRAGPKRETFIDPAKSCTISVEFETSFHKFFQVYRPKFDGTKLLGTIPFGSPPKIPVIPSILHEMEGYNELKMGYVEIQFRTPKDAQRLANLVKGDRELSRYWENSKAEIATGSRRP